MDIINKTKKKLHNLLEPNENGKLPPQAIEIEEAVLGAVLLESDAFDTVSSIIRSEHFYKEQNQLIFEAVTDLAQKNENIDILHVCQQLKINGKLEVCGGNHYVSSLTNRIASSAHIESHAHIVVEKFMLREMIRISTETIKLAYEENTDCFDLIDSSSNSVFNILNHIETKQTKSIGQIRDEIIAKSKEALFSEKPTGVPISLDSLQAQTNGWRDSNLIILAARPAMGKTAVALDYALHPATLGHPTMIFSLEMSASELTGRLMSKYSYISSQKINNNTCDTYELDAVIKDTEGFNKIPLYIDDTPALSITRLRSKALRAKREKGIKLIIVDYLQLMDGAEDDNKNREQEISKISRGLKKLAKELEIPIIALSQLSRKVEERTGKKPQLSDLRDSGSIEQDADMVIFLFRPEYYGMDQYDHGGENLSAHELLIKIIAKFRGGSTGDIKARWHGPTTSISNHSSDANKVVTSEFKPLQNNESFLRNNIEENF